jgi:hypothetical protein
VADRQADEPVQPRFLAAGTEALELMLDGADADAQGGSDLVTHPSSDQQVKNIALPEAERPYVCGIHGGIGRVLPQRTSAAATVPQGD